MVDGMNSQAYKDRMLNRDKLRLAVATNMADNKLDAILYPQQKILVVPITADDQLERNGTLSNSTGFPGGHLPGRVLRAERLRAAWRPVGAELLGLDYTRGQAPRLRLRVRAGSSFAQAASQHARPPTRALGDKPRRDVIRHFAVRLTLPCLRRAARSAHGKPLHSLPAARRRHAIHRDQASSAAWSSDRQGAC